MASKYLFHQYNLFKMNILWIGTIFMHYLIIFVIFVCISIYIIYIYIYLFLILGKRRNLIWIGAQIDGIDIPKPIFYGSNIRYFISIFFPRYISMNFYICQKSHWKNRGKKIVKIFSKKGINQKRSIIISMNNCTINWLL